MDDYNTKFKLIGDWKNKRRIFAKGVSLSVVHTGVNKMLSNAAVIENYKGNLKRLQEYHKFSEELIGNTIPPPFEVAFWKNNISRAQVATLYGYRYENRNSIYQELRKSPFWSLYHDSVSKFNKE